MLIREIKYVTDESLNVCDLSINMLTNTLKNIQNLILRSNSISSCNTLTVNNSRKNSNHLSPSINTNRLSINGMLASRNSSSFNFPNTLTKGFLYKTNTNGVLNINQHHSDFHADNFVNQYINTNGANQESNSYSADEDEENNLTAYEHSNKHKLRKSLPSQIIRRLPPQHPPVWSTTTSATGLPIVEPMPSRQRSLSLKGPTFSNSPLFDFKSQKPTDTLYSIQSQKLEANNQFKLKQVPLVSKIENEETSKTKLNRSYDDEEDETNPIVSANINIIANQSKITSDYDSGESPNSSDYNSDTDKLHLQVRRIFLLFFKNLNLISN